MADNQAISIALCTFHGARFLEELLISLANQTLLPGELIVCDDGSTDSTLAILERFASDSPFPVKIIPNTERLGYRNNFIRAARLCSNPIIAFCDQDDIWDRQKLQKCSSHFSDPSIFLVFHQATICNSAGLSTGEPVYPSTGKDFSLEIVNNPWFSPLGFTEVFRSSLLLLKHPLALTDHLEGGIIAHDHLAYVSALALGRVIYIEDSLASYRQHGANVAGARPRYGLKKKIKWLATNRADDYRDYADAAKGRAILLESQLASTDKSQPFVTPEIVRKYEILDYLYRLRADLYESRNMFVRASLYSKLLRDNAYSFQDLWLIPQRNRLRDLVLGVLLNKFLTRSKPRPLA